MLAPPPASLPPATESADESDLVAAALARGDRRAALAALMRAYGDEIYRFCFSMLGDRALCDDVHQAIFVDAFESLATLADHAKSRAWLYGIARHRCLDAAKARRRWHFRFILSRDAGSDRAASEPDVRETSESSPRSLALADCLRGLAPHVRVAVLLRYEDGLPYEEIARMSREKAATLQMRVARALLALRTCLEKKLEGWP